MKHRVVITVEGNKITDIVEVYGGDVARIPKCSVLPSIFPSDHAILFLPKDERMFIGIAKKADWWHRSNDRFVPTDRKGGNHDS